MAQISAAAEQEIKTLLVNWWTAVNAQLAAATGAAIQIGQAPVDLLFASEIGQRLVRVAEVAEAIQAAEARHETYPWSEQLAGEVLQDCEALEAWLNQGAVSHKTPNAFWTSPVGYKILCVRVWAFQDRLITLSAAAAISGMSLSVLSQRMTRGQLPGYRDPAVKNPRHARRVRLSELQTLVHENTGRILFSTAGYLMPQASQVPAPPIPRSS